MQAALFVIHFFYHAVEISKRTIADPHHFTRLKQRFRLRLLGTVIHALQNGICFTLGNRRHTTRLLRIFADETHHLEVSLTRCQVSSFISISTST